MENEPLILRIEEAKQELAQCVNDVTQKYGLNCYLIEPSFADLYAQVKMIAQQELAQAREQVKAQKAAQEENK